MTDDDSNQESLLEFPCDIQVKAMGRKDDSFRDHVLAIVRRHVSDATAIAVMVRPSKGDKYISVSCHFRAESRKQLDNIYQDFTADSRVLVAL